MENVIRNVGRISYISNLPVGEGTKIANDFMKRLVDEFSKQASLYMRETGEAPFVYSERQINSILAPAISKITNAFLMESPVERKWSTVDDCKYNDSYGRVDYWCYYRNTSFLIELKHGFVSSRSGKIRESVKKDWKEALSQLDVIEEEAKKQSEYCKGAFRLALHMLPIYETTNKIEYTKMNTSELIDIQKRVANELDGKPNWSALWILHDELFGPYEYINTKECYPGVLFICSLYEISKLSDK